MTGPRPTLTSAVERAALSIVGYVDEVSPARITIRLANESPRGFALGSGAPMGFPKLNGYLLIPAGTFDVVGVVTWIGTRRDTKPVGDSADLVDLPFPVTVLHLLPIGALTYRANGDEHGVQFERGIPMYPSVGDAVHLPASDQLDAVTAPHGEHPHIRIGRATIGSNQPIRFDPTLLFGHHLAVLGNTGSGKSCTVATLVRSSVLEAASIAKPAKPNTRFVVLDPNGEYAAAFADLPGGVRVIRPGAGPNALRIPAWMWSGAEWASLARAQAGTQHPVLMQALRDLKAAAVGDTAEDLAEVKRFANTHYDYLVHTRAWGIERFAETKNKKAIGDALETVSGNVERLRGLIDDDEDDVDVLLVAVDEACEAVLSERRSGNGWFDAFSEPDFDAILEPVRALCEHVGWYRHAAGAEDAPIKFDVGQIVSAVDTIASSKGWAQYVDTMSLRLRSMLEDTRCKSIIAPDTDDEPSVEDLLQQFLGTGSGDDHPVVVVDLSLIPSEIVHLVTAVISRIVFEGLQRVRTELGIEMPTVLVLEEAHTFVRSTQRDADEMGASDLCRATVERIAREGRKFGLGLVVSSQRPSELAPTVLSQCNTFILHRLVNDRDQELVRKLVPDAFGDLLRELPVLPTRIAAVLGLAVSAPTMVEVDELDEARRPHSNNPPYWDLWTKPVPAVDWSRVVGPWTGASPEEGA